MGAQLEFHDDWGPPDEDGAQFRFLVIACGYQPEESAGFQVGFLGLVLEVFWWQE